MPRRHSPFFPAPGPGRRERAQDQPFDLVARKRVASEPPESVESYRAGDVLAGKYELVRLLGRGGMSSVWAVQHLVLDTQFALKLIRNEGGGAHLAERMLREARSAARVEHPAIIRMLDFGVTDRGDPFLVMDLLSGGTVRERLRTGGRFTPVEAVRLLLPIAEALSVAHSHGVVHRDLKPDNIVCVAAEGGRCQPTIIDFGIARQMGEESSRITQNGMVIGSPEYMSPEQAQGLLDVGHETDVWSFCVVLYEMVTGTTPFFREGALGPVLHGIIWEPAPPISSFGIHDPELWSILARGLQKQPRARWHDMRSLGIALAGWLLDQGVEEDVCMQSIPMVWFGRSSSMPPVAMDADTRDERARLAALAEDYDIPKKGISFAALGLVATTLVVTLIGIAAFRMAHGSGAMDSVSSPGPSQGTAGPTAPAPVTPAPAPRAAAPSADPGAATREGTAEERAAPATRAAPSPAPAPAPRTPRDVPRITKEPKPISVGSRADDTTVLPEVKPPPSFDGTDGPHDGD
jgi:eukaryotic-like serine/threonine-protein kinase